MKTITRAQYLQGLALFVLAVEYRRKTDECQRTLERLLGVEKDSHVGDAIFTTDGNYDEALGKAGIEWVGAKP
jgi:hypothetical protein